MDREHFGYSVIEKCFWEKWYGADFSGKRILDAGAGCGESASFFFNRGAVFVQAIEPNPVAVRALFENAKINDWNIRVKAGIFSLEDLSGKYDILKIDIEGAEILLLSEECPKLENLRIELHPQLIGQELCRRLVSKFNLKPIQKPYVWRN